MPAYLSKFLCYVVISLQALTSFASAQGLMLCVPTGGEAHIETRAQQQDCLNGSKSDQSGKASIGDAVKPCLDLPVAGSGHGPLRPTQQAVQFDTAQFIAVLPQFLQITLDPFEAATTPRVEAVADRVPDAALDSLGSVILVI